MENSRREFIMGAGAFSAGVLAIPMTSERAEAAAGWFSLVRYAPAFANSLWRFGLNVLNQGAATALGNWISNAWAAPAPPPRTFSERFNPKVVINIQQQPRFTAPTVIRPARALVVAQRPSLVNSYGEPLTQASVLNEREMNEFCNSSNPLIYQGQYQLPMSYSDRLSFTTDELRGFQSRAANLRNPYLEYVRHFCTCDGRHLIGYGYRCGSNGEIENFNVRMV